ncbi:MAG: sodium:proton antiporter [Chitinophagaceae bacterium]|nr:sodium:proton antiporter [Chitinophagaceae bacterium]
MNLFHLTSILIVLSAIFAYINHRVLKLPNAIGLMLVSLLFSIFVIISGSFFPSLKPNIEAQLGQINFSELLLEGMLSFMLFAGAIHVKFKDLNTEKWSILLLSTMSVLISTFAVGFSTFYLLNAFGIEVSFISALLFGSLISPTDPIAVLSILKKAGVSKSIETKIAGESLFNDGVAVVIFMTILGLTKPDAEPSYSYVLELFAQEAIGGVLLGIVVGWLGYKLIASIDNYQVEVLVTLAVVMGGYTLAHAIHVSGPLAMVLAGLITGNQAKSKGMSEITAEYIDKFWELIDEILNAILFVLIGLELLILETNSTIILASIIMIFLVLAIRYISVFIPSLLIVFKEKLSKKTLRILTWGGLRGGISIALALSIPNELNKEVWVTITYVIVCFSILVQGLTIGKLAKK